MVKQKNEGDSQKQQEEVPKNVQPKKKVIKKIMPFKKKQDKQDGDQLKDWKPTKIERKNQTGQVEKKESKNIAESFLGSLSRPINKAEDKTKKNHDMFDEDDHQRRPLIKTQLNLKNITQEQRKWDIEDQTFIRKQFIPKGPIQRKLQEQEDQEEPEEQQIKILGKNGQTGKVRKIDLNKIIDNDWKEEARRKNARNQLWEGAEGVLDGRGNLAKMAREALQKANDIDSELNKRTQQRKQMRSRYGW